MPKYHENTPFAHNDLIGRFGGKRTQRGGEWTTEFPSREHFDRYRAHVAAAAPPPAAAAAGPPDPARHGYMRNKFDTWSNGRRVPAGEGWVKRSPSGAWVGYAHDEAVRRVT